MLPLAIFSKFYSAALGWFVPGIVPGSPGAGSGEEVMGHYGFTATKITRGGNMRKVGVFF